MGLKVFFDRVRAFILEEGPLLPDTDFEPPIQLPIGLKIQVASPNLTDDEKKKVPHIKEGCWDQIDNDGCITVGRLDFSKR